MTQLTFVGSTAALEESQIWVPEVELYSGSMSITDLPRKEVIIYHNGSAFWSRPGEVSSMCEECKSDTHEATADFFPGAFNTWPGGARCPAVRRRLGC